MIFEKEDVVAAASNIDMVPSRAGITPSEFIQLRRKGDKITMQMAAEIYGEMVMKAAENDKDKDWSFWVDRLSLIPFVRIAKENGAQHFKFELRNPGTSNQILTVVNGRRKVDFNTIPEITGYTSDKGGNGDELELNTEQKKLLRLAAKFATQDPTLAYINCVYLVKGDCVLSTNRSALFYAKDPIIPVSVPFPLMLVDLLGSDEVHKVTITKKVVRLDMAGGYLCQVMNAEAIKNFPLKMIRKQFKMAESYTPQFTVKAKPFLDAMSRLALYVSNVVNRQTVVQISGTKGSNKLKLFCMSPQGKFEERVKAVKPLKHDVSLSWLLESVTPLVDYVEDISTITVKYDDAANTPYYLGIGDKAGLLLCRKK